VERVDTSSPPPIIDEGLDADRNRIKRFIELYKVVIAVAVRPSCRGAAEASCGLTAE
jgi:hypothetical protein